jgi:hypothetical protein
LVHSWREPLSLARNHCPSSSSHVHFPPEPARNPGLTFPAHQVSWQQPNHLAHHVRPDLFAPLQRTSGYHFLFLQQSNFSQNHSRAPPLSMRTSQPQPRINSTIPPPAASALALTPLKAIDIYFCSFSQTLRTSTLPTRIPIETK